MFRLTEMILESISNIAFQNKMCYGMIKNYGKGRNVYGIYCTFRIVG